MGVGSQENTTAPPIVYWPTLMEEFYGAPVQLQRAVTFAIRSPGAGSEALLGEIRGAVRPVSPNLPLTRVARSAGRVDPVRTLRGE